MNPFFTCLLLPFLLNPALKRTKRHLHESPNPSLIFSQHLHNFSVSHCGIQKPQCGIYISQCGIQKPHCETELFSREKTICIPAFSPLSKSPYTQYFQTSLPPYADSLLPYFPALSFFLDKKQRKKQKIRYIYHKELL